MTVLSTRVIKKQRKTRYCSECGYMVLAGDSIVRLYGFGDIGDKPFPLYFCLSCADERNIIPVKDGNK